MENMENMKNMKNTKSILMVAMLSALATGSVQAGLINNGFETGDGSAASAGRGLPERLQRPHGRDRAVAQRVGSLRFPCILFALS